jgi:O-succinylbenzoate synthase
MGMFDPVELHVYAIPMRTRFRGIMLREGMVVRGEAGWGEFCPFNDYSDEESVPWLASALESASTPWPTPLRSRIPVNVTVPVVTPQRAFELVSKSGCQTAKVKVADPGLPLEADLDRVAAVREALGSNGKIRIDANAAWDVETAITSIILLNKAAGGLEYVEQPCASLEDLAKVRQQVHVPIAADESIRRAEDPLRVVVAGAADIAVLKVAPLGGIRAALKVAESAGIPCVVSSALETSIGLRAELGLAAALPTLNYACGLGTTSLLSGDLVGDSIQQSDGWIDISHLPTAPDPSRLAEFEADPETTRRWMQRYDNVRALLRARG